MTSVNDSRALHRMALSTCEIAIIRSQMNDTQSEPDIHRRALEYAVKARSTARNARDRDIAQRLIDSIEANRSNMPTGGVL